MILSQPNHDTEKERTTLREIVNGSSVLPDLIFEKLKTFHNFRYLERTRVTGLNQTVEQGGVEVMVVDERNSDKNQSSLFCDNVIITATAKARVEHSKSEIQMLLSPALLWHSYVITIQ